MQVWNSVSIVEEGKMMPPPPSGPSEDRWVNPTWYENVSSSNVSFYVDGQTDRSNYNTLDPPVQG